MKCNSSKSFLLITIHLMGGLGGHASLQIFNFQLRASNFFFFNMVRTLLQFFARIKNSTPFLSSDSALFGKNTGGWGTLLPQQATEMFRIAAGPLKGSRKVGAGPRRLRAREVSGSQSARWQCPESDPACAQTSL